MKSTKRCKYLNYVEHLLILVLTFSGCDSISSFASLVCVAVGFTNSALGTKTCAITAGTKKYISVTMKKNKKHDKRAFLGKDTLNTTEVLISKALIDSYISHNQFALINTVLREYNGVKNYV